MEHKLVNGIQVNLTPEEIAQRQQDETAWNNGAFDRAMADLRQKRNTLLSASDWTQLPDTTLTTAEKTSWMNYRSELRNITNGLTTVEDVNGVSFPVKPS
jgi:endonuclease/exonuclease/phosphatase family metal-dependent hydrolase